MDIKKLLNQAKTAFADDRQIPPVNGMSDYIVRHIQEKVQKQTDFNVACMDSSYPNLWTNVGLIMPTNTLAGKIAKAEDVFIAAALELGEQVERRNILHFVPGTIYPPSRLTGPASTTVWYPDAPKP